MDVLFSSGEYLLHLQESRCWTHWVEADQSLSFCQNLNQINVQKHQTNGYKFGLSSSCSHNSKSYGESTNLTHSPTFSLCSLSLSLEMAHASIARATYLVVFVVACFLSAAVVKAQEQDTVPAPAPSPTIEHGSGFAVPVSGAVVCCSVLISMVALLRQ